MTVRIKSKVLIDQIITAPIPEFCELSGLGRTTVGNLLNNGIEVDGELLKLESVAVGSRRLIIIDSWRRIVERQRKHPVKLGLRGRGRKMPLREASDRPADRVSGE